MILGLTGVDFKNSGWNGLRVLGHMAGGAAVAGVINSVAHKLFGLKKDSVASKISSVLSFAAGIGASVVYFTPRTSLAPMAWEIVAKLVGVHVVAMIAAQQVIDSSWIFLVPTLLGSVSGGAGRYSLYAAGAFGSFIGVAMSEPKK